MITLTLFNFSLHFEQDINLIKFIFLILKYKNLS